MTKPKPTNIDWRQLPMQVMRRQLNELIVENQSLKHRLEQSRRDTLEEVEKAARSKWKFFKDADYYDDLSLMLSQLKSKKGSK